MSAISFSAVVLAAGRSSRMGRDKALLETAGTPWWRRQRETLARAGAAEIFLSARPEQSWVAGAATEFAAVVTDDAPAAGPLAGLTAGLARATHGHLAALAVDLPAMEPAWFARLRGACSPGVGAVGQRDGFFEPLAAIYPREFLPAARAALAHGEYALQPLLAAAVAAGRIRALEISADEKMWFENRNEPEVVGPS